MPAGGVRSSTASAEPVQLKTYVRAVTTKPQRLDSVSMMLSPQPPPRECGSQARRSNPLPSSTSTRRRQFHNCALTVIWPRP